MTAQNVVRANAKAERESRLKLSGFCEQGNCSWCHLSICTHACHQTSGAESGQAADLDDGSAPEPDIKPGLHFDLPNDDYHALTDWWSSSQLKKALPEIYKEFTGETPALSFGTLVHSVVLEPDSLDCYVALDAETIGRKSDGSLASNPTMTNAWKQAVAEVEQDGKTVVAQSDWDMAHRMRDALAAHPVAGPLLFDGEGANEESAFAVDENGVRHKARFDRRVPGGILDLKTTSAKPGESSLTRAVVDYGYELSAAHYLAVADLLGLDASYFTLVFVGKADPYRVTVCDLDDLLLMRGRDLRARALERLAKTVEPYDGATSRLYLTCPDWALPYEAEMEI